MRKNRRAARGAESFSDVFVEVDAPAADRPMAQTVGPLAVLSDLELHWLLLAAGSGFNENDLEQFIPDLELRLHQTPRSPRSAVVASPRSPPTAE